ncbi:hypothetical protein PISMIDRAFT_385096 [Pisolithus microcarpus 441]|uniref:DRBM domain-containing protein n=1 Tax=Pisolithus microcarpus 441 TaxID=765257 RepID=A0A0D0A6Q6_9AGAM|nr:hypothetical protein BKA83DRAFT_2261930 [Pisolithus microcarpus]KIK30107.1 hypothetical protein PISMIDRAFT_385096 [Pisolithus microcarpus 441]
MSRVDPIVELNNYLQSTGQLTALSWKDSKGGSAHSPQWNSVCKIYGREYGTGTGAQKHLARGTAAAQALNALRDEAGGG